MDANADGSPEPECWITTSTLWRPESAKTKHRMAQDERKGTTDHLPELPQKSYSSLNGTYASEASSPFPNNEFSILYSNLLHIARSSKSVPQVGGVPGYLGAILGGMCKYLDCWAPKCCLRFGPHFGQFRTRSRGFLFRGFSGTFFGTSVPECCLS